MGKLECISISGIATWFWSDDHNPPHFHAKRMGEWEVQVNFLEPDSKMLKFKWRNKPMSKQDRQAIINAVDKHRDQMFAEWLNKVNQ